MLVRSIRHAAALSDIAPPHWPWLPPLPAELAADRRAAGCGRSRRRAGRAAARRAALGAQRRQPGAARRLRRRARRRPGRRPHVGRATARTRTSATSTSSTLVVTSGSTRRRTCRTARASCDRTSGSAWLDCSIGWSASSTDGGPPAAATNARRSSSLSTGSRRSGRLLDGPRDGTRWEQLGASSAEGAAVGMSCVVTAERPGPVPPAVLAACAERWIFHLDDAGEATSCGLRPVAVPAAIPGRLVVASSGCEAQLAVPAGLPSRRSRWVGGPAEIDVLPAIVDAATMPAGRVTAAGELELAVGIDFAGLGVACLEVPDGEHVLVAGPPRSGRTTALHRLVTSWVEARPGEQVVVGRRHAVARCCRSSPIVVEARRPSRCRCRGGRRRPAVPARRR